MSAKKVVLGVGALVVASAAGLLTVEGQALSQGAKPPPNSYMPVVPKEDFATVMKRMQGDKAKIEKAHQDLLAARYDLGNHAAKGAKMFRGKAVQGGVRARLAKGVT
jgi:hypothetical protein